MPSNSPPSHHNGLDRAHHRGKDPGPYYVGAWNVSHSCGHGPEGYKDGNLQLDKAGAVVILGTLPQHKKALECFSLKQLLGRDMLSSHFRSLSVCDDIFLGSLEPSLHWGTVPGMTTAAAFRSCRLPSLYASCSVSHIPCSNGEDLGLFFYSELYPTH